MNDINKEITKLNEEINLVGVMDAMSKSETVYATRVHMITDATHFLRTKMDEALQGSEDQKMYAGCILLLKELLLQNIKEFTDKKGVDCHGSN